MVTKEITEGKEQVILHELYQETGYITSELPVSTLSVRTIFCSDE
jgi:hypothetical protein